MISLLFATVLALAADQQNFPVMADVALPATGTVRIHIPPELRTPGDPADASDLLLVDAEGRPVPVARIDTQAKWDANWFGDAAEVPTAVPDVWEIDVGQRPVDGLRIAVASVGLGITATVRDEDGEIVGGPTLVWRMNHASQDIVPIEPSSGKLLVTLQHHGHAPRHAADIRPLRLVELGVEDETLRVPITEIVVQENGWVRYDIDLPRPLPVKGVRVLASEPIFDRMASVQSIPWESTPTAQLTYLLYPDQSHPIRRVRFGEVAVDASEVPVRLSDDRLALLIDSNRRSALDVTEVDLVLPGVHLLVTDAGPGPHTLYAGAPMGTSPLWDLAAATPELARVSVEVVEPSAPRANLAWVPPEVRANLVAPSTEIALDGFAWRRPVEGQGLMRIPLSDDVLAHSRANLSDLRLVTDDGLQVPYLLRRRGGEHAWEDLETTRTERGKTSIISITLPYADTPVSSVHLATSAPVFERQVTLSRPAGAQLSPLRTVRWVATDRPGTLGIDVGGRVGATLVIQIENGDDPPLPIDDIEVRWPAWELIAVLPEGPVSLYSGDPRRQAPDYDISLLSEEVRVRAVDVATLGDRTSVEPPPLSGLDKGLLGAGVAILMMGLLGLLLALLRAADPEPTPAVSDG